MDEKAVISQGAYLRAALDLLQQDDSAALMYFKVVSNSMRPWFQAGDMLRVERVPVRNLQSGDMIVWRDQQGLMAHRLLLVGPEKLITKGDAVASFDPPLAVSAVVGRVATLQQGERLFDFSALRWRNCTRWQTFVSLLEGRLTVKLGRWSRWLVWPLRRLTLIWFSLLKNSKAEV